MSPFHYLYSKWGLDEDGNITVQLSSCRWCRQLTNKFEFNFHYSITHARFLKDGRYANRNSSWVHKMNAQQSNAGAAITPPRIPIVRSTGSGSIRYTGMGQGSAAVNLLGLSQRPEILKNDLARKRSTVWTVRNLLVSLIIIFWTDRRFIKKNI